MRQVGDTVVVRHDLKRGDLRHSISVFPEHAENAGKALKILEVSRNNPKTDSRNNGYRLNDRHGLWYTESMLEKDVHNMDSLIHAYVMGQIGDEEYKLLLKSITTGSD